MYKSSIIFEQLVFIIHLIRSSDPQLNIKANPSEGHLDTPVPPLDYFYIIVFLSWDYCILIIIIPWHPRPTPGPSEDGRQLVCSNNWSQPQLNLITSNPTPTIIRPLTATTRVFGVQGLRSLLFHQQIINNHSFKALKTENGSHSISDDNLMTRYSLCQVKAFKIDLIDNLNNTFMHFWQVNWISMMLLHCIFCHNKNVVIWNTCQNHLRKNFLPLLRTCLKTIFPHNCNGINLFTHQSAH